MKLLKIHHIAIICSDYKKSRHFYVDVLGFKVLNEVYREARNSYKLDLGFGDHYQIELFSFPNPPPRLSQPEARGLRHMAFLVENIEETVTELNSQGVTTEPLRVDEYTGKRYTFFNDPDGLPLELYEK